MAGATFAIPGFHGGEISQFAQGRFDKPDYKISLNVCSNAIITEIGTWVPRPGTMHGGTTLNGAPGRVMEFEFEQAAAVTVELTDGAARFRNGPTLITVNGSATIHQIATPWAGAAWRNLRLVQAETTAIGLTATVAPQALVVSTLPSPGVNAQFSLSPATFNDGPYLDPFTNGVQATPSAKTGIITLALSFAAFDATKAYPAGSFASSSGVVYVSLLDQNVNNAPASLAPWWAASSAAAAINNGQGFLGTDTGRLVRLFSEPAAWLVGSTYAAAAVVSYNPTGLPGASTYWSSQAGGNTGNIPGADLTHWTLMPAGAAIWSWGKITGLSTIIDRALSGSASIGDMTAGGGLAAAFDGVFSQAASASAKKTGGAGTALSSYVGKNYSGASDQKIASATVYPSNDLGLAFVTPSLGSPPVSITLNLRGKSTAPASASDGTLLGTSGPIANTFSAVTILSSDQATAWKYVWIEQISTTPANSYINAIAELSFFGPPGSGTSSGVNVEILGPPLPYTTTINTWRMGKFSNTTGFPTGGLYHDGRLWLGGAVPNSFDASTSNAIQPGSSTVNFAPTDQYGAVLPSSGISETLNGDGVNPIQWMKPDLQGILMGTQAGEFLVFPPTPGGFAPNNISSRQLTGIGSANIQPCQTEHTWVFVQRFTRKLMEYFPDVYSGKFSAPNLADKTIRTKPGVAELAYTNAVNPVLWGRNTDGTWWGVTYKRDSLASSQPPTFYAWHGHALGSGRAVESMCGGASAGGNLDTLTMVTNDPLTGTRHVEVLTDAGDELSPLATAWYLDDAVIPAQAQAAVSLPTLPYGGLTLSGLPYPDGKTVQVFAGGLDCGDRGPGTSGWTDFVVAGGAVTVPYGDGLSAGPGRGLFTAAFVAAAPQIIAGFTYNSDGQSVRMIAPADSGSRSGPSLGLLRRVHRYALLLANTLGISVGTIFAKLDPVKLKDAGGEDDIPAGATFSGLAQDAIEGGDDYDGMIAWRVSRPFPASVAAIAGNLNTKDQ